MQPRKPLTPRMMRTSEPDFCDVGVPPARGAGIAHQKPKVGNAHPTRQTISRRHDGHYPAGSRSTAAKEEAMHRAMKRRWTRPGLSTIEMVVVVSVVGLLIALVLPALQAARESSRRTTCSNNLRQQGAAFLQFEQSKGRFPSGGEGTDTSVNPPTTVFELSSTFTQVLNFLEENPMISVMDQRYAYNDAAWPANQAAAKMLIPTFLCPSNVFYVADPNNYGQSDYMPVVYTDIDPKQGIRNPAARWQGAFRLGGMPTGQMIDGMSKTVAMVEDSARNWEGLYPNMKSPFADPVFSNGNVWNGSKQVSYSQWCKDNSLTSQGLPVGDTATPSGNRAMNRWAEPAIAGGVSGQANSTVGAIVNPINGNAVPTGGPPNCLWHVTNCGPNEEPFSFHTHGINVVMCDGSTRFISKDIDLLVMRKLVTPDEQTPYDDAAVRD
jgi:type II secretory pathway pseudopilin PulG